MTQSTAHLPRRSSITPEYTWNAPSVYPSLQAWEAEFKAVEELLSGLARFQGHLSDGPVVLADWLDAYGEVGRRVEKLVLYARMSYSVDTTDQTAAALAGKAQGLVGRSQAATAFAKPEMLALGQATVRQWMEQEPRLAPYRHYFDNLFRLQEHVRSPEVEELLGLLSEPFGGTRMTAEALVNADLAFRPAVGSDGLAQPVAQGNIGKLLSSSDRELRRTAWESYADAYLAAKNTLAANLLTSARQDVFLARARRFGSSLEAALFEHNIPVGVFHNLIDTYRKQLPTWHRYWGALRRGLGVEELHPYDIWAPLTDKVIEVPYHQAVEWIAEGMKPLGEEYVNALRQGCLVDRWVDIYPNHGKRQGAFSYGAYDTYPFIMMSYNDTVGSMSTLAHELGHSMHHYYTQRAQPYIYSDYSLFVAEVASNFNQAMLRAYLFQHHDDPDFQIALIQEAMSNFHRYFFIMPTLARFELEVHQRIERGQGVTAADLIELMADLFEEGYGGQVRVDRERVGITWAQFNHLYVAYYTFQYATGISGAHVLAERVLSGEAEAVAAYLGFLKAGGSGYPLDVLKAAGVDLSSPEPVEKTFGVLAGLVDRLEKLVAL